MRASCLARPPFSLALPTSVELKVYDLRGRLVATLVDEARAPGDYVEVWGGTDASGRAVASGTYFARFAAGGVVQTQRMVLLR